MLKKNTYSIKYNDELKDSGQLEFHENPVHKKDYDAINCLEYLKNA